MGAKVGMFAFLGVKEAYGCQVLRENHQTKTEQMFEFYGKYGSCTLKKQSCM